MIFKYFTAIHNYEELKGGVVAQLAEYEYDFVGPGWCVGLDSPGGSAARIQGSSPQWGRFGNDVRVRVAEPAFTTTSTTTTTTTTITTTITTTTITIVVTSYAWRENAGITMSI
jgi:hypothetical protein